MSQQQHKIVIADILVFTKYCFHKKSKVLTKLKKMLYTKFSQKCKRMEIAKIMFRKNCEDCFDLKSGFRDKFRILTSLSTERRTNGKDLLPKIVNLREDWMIYKGPGFLAVVWFVRLHAHPLLRPSRHQVASLSHSCVSPVELTDGMGRGGGGRGAYDTTRKKAWPSINCSRLSG